MTEAQYQKKLIDRHEKEGWTVIKLIMCNKAGLPDLICMKPDEVKFIEVKGPKGRLSEIQKYRIEELKEKGFACKSYETLLTFVDKCVYNVDIETTPSNDQNKTSYSFRKHKASN